MAKERETIVQTSDVRVRIMELDAEEIGPWHYHSEVTDHIVCLSGKIAVEFEDSPEESLLDPGGRCVVECGRTHRVSNPERERASYLLVQGVGRYDFNLFGK